MKETVCFVTSVSGNNIEPTDFFRKDGCYGSEYAIFETARRLAQIYDVYVTIGKPEQYFERVDGINWVSECDFNRWSQYVKPQHIVVVRYVSPFVKLAIPPGAKLYFWLHDVLPLFHDPQIQLPPFFIGLMNRFVDRYISVGSQAIQNHYVPKWKMDPSKFTVIKNGITLEKDWDPVSSVRSPLSFVYSSSVGKGLWRLLEIWPRILKEFPIATLEIYYGYQKSDEDRLREFIEKYPSVTYHGKVAQRDLFAEYKKMDYWLFPCQDEETCSTTTFETAYYGVIQISNDKGPLKENVSGYKFQDNERFVDNVVSTIRQLESDSRLKELIRKRQFKFSLKNTWEHRATQWHNLFKGL